MNRSFYSEYAQHALRFYVRYTDVDLKTVRDADALNWACCERAVQRLGDDERLIVTLAYQSSEPMADTIKRITQEYGVSDKSVWRLLRRVEQMFAAERGLI